jgi:hypothetical protein
MDAPILKHFEHSGITRPCTAYLVLTNYVFGSRVSLEIIVRVVGNEGQKTKIGKPSE